MPAGKNRKAITLSFSKKNEDIADLLDSLKSDIKGFNQNDFICEAIRFYNNNKDKFNLTKEEILRLIDERILKLKAEFENNSNTFVKKENEIDILKNKLNSLSDDDLEED